MSLSYIEVCKKAWLSRPNSVKYISDLYQIIQNNRFLGELERWVGTEDLSPVGQNSVGGRAISCSVCNSCNKYYCYL